jgi:hypothetical protein
MRGGKSVYNGPLLSEEGLFYVLLTLYKNYKKPGGIQNDKL